MEVEAGPAVANRCIGFRHLQVLLLFLGLALAFGMRVNMSIAIVGMTTHPRSEGHGAQGVEDHDYLDWRISTQGIVLSSFIVGFVISQASGYFLAGKFGGKLLMTVGVAVSAALSAFIPLGAYDGGWMLMCLCRGIQGLAQGSMIPAIHHLFENWIPVENRRLMITLVVACGMQLGTAFQFSISGFIIKYWGWEVTFYINFVTGVIWSIIYVILGSSYAETSKYISEDEKKFIRDSLLQETERKNLKMPWHALWTSLPVLTLVLACCAQQWGQWTIMTMFPIYLNLAYNADIEMIGVLTAVPYFAMFLMVFPFCCLSDCIVKKNCLSVTVIRKTFNTIGFLGPAICLVAISYLSSDLTVTAMLLILFMAFNAAQYSGFMSSHEDMAPNFSDTLKRTTVSFADVLSIFAPLTAVGMLVNQQDLSDWRYVFNLSASLYIACGAFYVIFGTSVRQQWNDIGPPAHRPARAERVQCETEEDCEQDCKTTNT